LFGHFGSHPGDKIAAGAVHWNYNIRRHRLQLGNGLIAWALTIRFATLGLAATARAKKLPGVLIR